MRIGERVKIPRRDGAVVGRVLSIRSDGGRVLVDLPEGPRSFAKSVIRQAPGERSPKDASEAAKRRAEALDMYESRDFTVRDIAAHYGVDEKRVRNWLLQERKRRADEQNLREIAR